MDPHGHIAEEFAISQRIVRAGVDVVPRFKIFAPDGEHVAFVQLPGDMGGRIKQCLSIRFDKGLAQDENGGMSSRKRRSL